MDLIHDPNEIYELTSRWRRSGKRVGIVPTMGALHAGHLSLVQASRQECDATVTTIFVNPTQFGPNEDFNRYPRTLDDDVRLLEQQGCDAVFAPAADDIYRKDASTWVAPAAVAEPLEGRFRPDHFRGVATIVLKLFHLIPADAAYFGQKDFQQCRVIEQMVMDLNVPILIRRCPIVRESDGLAMSSRNRYLSSSEREQALALSRSLRAGQQLILDGQQHADVVRSTMMQVLREAGISRVDYVSVADPSSLNELDRIAGPSVLLIAAHVGQTRLIDNCLVG